MHVFRARFHSDTAARIQGQLAAVATHPRWTERHEADLIRAALVVGVMALAKAPAKAYERAIEELASAPAPAPYKRRKQGRPSRRTA